MPNLPITIVFHTHNRSDCLVETINSFFYHNDPKDFHKLYLLDDHSTKERDYSVEDYKQFREDKQVYGHDYFKYSNPKDYVFGLDYAQEKGIELLHRNNKQLGCWPTIDKGFRKLKNLIPEDSLVLYLQNDCRFIRPLPIAVIQHLINNNNVHFIRLYGKYKNMEYKQWKDKKFDKTFIDKQYVLGEKMCIHPEIYYSGQPHIATLSFILKFALGCKYEGAATKRSLKKEYEHLRRALFFNNVTEHFGVGTPGGLFGQAKKQRLYTKLEKKIKADNGKT